MHPCCIAWWLLLGETADLSSETNAVIKLLHPQRLFGMSLKKIKLAMDEETVGKEGLPPTAGKRGKKLNLCFDFD